MLRSRITSLVIAALLVPALAAADPVDNRGLDIPDPQQSPTTTITEYTDQAAWETAVSLPILVECHYHNGCAVLATQARLLQELEALREERRRHRRHAHAVARGRHGGLLDPVPRRAQGHGAGRLPGGPDRKSVV